MSYVATEMEKAGMNLPILIGGATTSKQHTAIKIAPGYSNAVVHVKDASKTTQVVRSLLSADAYKPYTDGIKEDYQQIREKYANRVNPQKYITIEEARKNKLVLDWENFETLEPASPGIHIIENQELQELIPFIDWTFFLFSWDIKGKYPAVLKDPVRGSEAKKLIVDAEEMLEWLVNDGRLKAKGSYGIIPAHSDTDDIVLLDQDGKETSRFYHLRNQEEKEEGVPNLSLSDFIRPRTPGKTDYVGVFAVTAGIGIEPIVKEFEENNDDYRAIMVKILADRLAEAFAEMMHYKVRTEHWGYAKNESLPIEAILREEYQGTRPASGYPACPDHQEKLSIFKVLNAEKIGIELTENLAMTPGASVSGWYFSHPQSKYFNIGRIEKDQFDEYCERRGCDPKDAAKFLTNNLNFTL
jgi:5-methyltetrahydrofolate--homocysteine methyltransferase